MICPIHSLELEHRQGVSKKTGKDYDFWACPNKEGGQFCSYTAPNTPQASTSPEKVTPGVQLLLDRIGLLESNLMDILKKGTIPLDKTSENDNPLF